MAERNELKMYVVSVDVKADEYVARTVEGTELARVKGEGTADTMAELARKADAELKRWYH